MFNGLYAKYSCIYRTFLHLNNSFLKDSKVITPKKARMKIVVNVLANIFLHLSNFFYIPLVFF